MNDYYTVKLILNDGEVIYYTLNREEWYNFSRLLNEKAMIKWLLNNGSTYDPEPMCNYTLVEKKTTERTCYCSMFEPGTTCDEVDCSGKR